MSRFMTLVYGVVVYVLFLGVFLYAIGFVGCIGVSRCINDGPTDPLGTALLIDAALLLVFAVQHSVMARPWFKQGWTKLVSPAAERSTYVLFSSAALALLFWQWRPLAGTVWAVEAPAGRMALWALFALGWLIVLGGTFMINHFDLFGLRQVWLHFRGQPYTPVPFRTVMLYRYTRNPLMLGFVIAFWAAPTMSVARLVFAVATTGYILVGIMLEEQDHARHLGDAYREYQARIPMLIPLPRRRR